MGGLAEKAVGKCNCQRTTTLLLIRGSDHGGS
jgi:hypothetical protein